MRSEGTSKKEFSLTQYYAQLTKYESSGAGGRPASLKKEYSLTSLQNRPSDTKPSAFAKSNKQPQKLGLSDKNPSSTFKQNNTSVLEKGYDKASKTVSPLENYKGRLFGESLNTSTLTSKKWQQRQEKENLHEVGFNSQDEEEFVTHCSQLYKMNEGVTVEQLSREIDKRDEVFQVVSQYMEPSGAALQRYFAEHELMQKIIEEFKGISRLQMSDLNELYYFLKSDRE